METSPLIIKKDDHLKKNIINELIYISKTSIPISISALIQGSIFILNSLYIGKQNAEIVAAMGLTMLIIMLTGVSPLNGVIVALDTLCSQAYTGSRDKKILGIYLQRALLILLIMYIPIFILWWNSYHILILLKQKQDIALLSSIITKYFCFTVPLLLVSNCLKRFLQAQSIIYPSIICSVMVLIFHLVQLKFYFSYTKLGIHGVYISTLVSYIFNTILLILCVRFSKASEFWGGFSKDAFKHWQEFLKIGLPNVLMSFGEIIPLDFIALVCSYFGSVLLGAQTIISNLNMLFYFIYIGLSISCSIRIGNLLGSNKPREARLVSFIGVSLSFLVGLYLAYFVNVYKITLVNIFCSDLDIQEVIMPLIPIISVGQIFQSIGIMTAGILRGQGRQNVGAFFKFTGCYFVSIPFGIFLAYFFGLNFKGLWIGLTISWLYSALGELYYIWNTNWNQEVVKCLNRVSV